MKKQEAISQARLEEALEQLGSALREETLQRPGPAEERPWLEAGRRRAFPRPRTGFALGALFLVLATSALLPAAVFYASPALFFPLARGYLLGLALLGGLACIIRPEKAARADYRLVSLVLRRRIVIPATVSAAERRLFRYHGLYLLGVSALLAGFF